MEDEHEHSQSNSTSTEEVTEHDHDHSNSTSTAEEVTEVTGCHAHGETLFCVAGEEEWEVLSEVDVSNAPEEFTDCHAHDDEV